MLNLKKYIKELNLVLDEISSGRENIKKVISELDSLDGYYQSGELDYKAYTEFNSKILSKRSRDQVLESYANYMNSLRKRLYIINSKIAKAIFHDKGYLTLQVGKLASKKGKKTLPSLESLEIGEVKREISREIDISTEISEEEVLQETPKKAPVKGELYAPGPEAFTLQDIPKPVKLGFFKRLAYAFQAKEKPWLDKYEQGNVVLGGIFSKEFLEYLLFGKEKNQEAFGQTKILPSILTYEKNAFEDDELGLSKSDILNPYLLEKQIKELKSIISKKKPEIYKASMLGYFANMTVRKISIYFIEKNPDFFKKVYKAVRYSNMKMLANTYINIMFFLTIVSGLISIPFFTVIFTLEGNPPFQVFLRTVGASLFVANMTFWLSYYYPFTKAKSRKRSINTNLPFAIDHMSSVIASGVSPATMFKLISSSREYGEISIEIEKVTSYVDFFGYDILTALKAVSLTTPSEDFKEFIDGFVSTIETGGDIKEYLSEKSSEALLNYRLERQKYVESLSTYSDIYTGVLIAAPLFFVTALSLVSVIGGTIGGIGINTIITIGTYVAIPIMNLLFIIFLEMNQPEI